MAALRPVEERDARGVTNRLNPSITFRQDREIRKVVGRHDFKMTDNPDYHEPVTAQVQNGEIEFFFGTPDSSRNIAMAKHIKKEDVKKKVPAYIIAELTKNPIRVREQRPAVYEVRVTTMGDIETTETNEIVLPAGTTEVNIRPVENVPPNHEGVAALMAAQRGGKANESITP